MFIPESKQENIAELVKQSLYYAKKKIRRN